jgi:carboxymethylenebutenolidase
MASPLNAKISSHDSKSFGAYVAKAKDAHAPVMIVIQEIFGVNAGLRQMCDEWAANGFHAVCPDLFWRIEPGLELSDAVDAEKQKAFALFNAFDTGLGVKDLQSTLTYARSFDSAKVGSVGFCLGGKLAYMMAAQTDADCNISYYGVGLDAMLDDVPGIKRPLLIHIAGNDAFTSSDQQKQILAGVKGNAKIEAHIYAGVEHAFARVNGMHYDAAAAQLANARTLAFAKKHLIG